LRTQRTIERDLDKTPILDRPGNCEARTTEEQGHCLVMVYVLELMVGDEDPRLLAQQVSEPTFQPCGRFYEGCSIGSRGWRFAQWGRHSQRRDRELESAHEPKENVGMERGGPKIASPEGGIPAVA
jgi:hypothetical protein